jgi:hypothetical protein|tara:strand:- start:39024 stop:39824 length:801 start_codon:yes stop_codon:yes gene_type:complete
LGFIGLPILRLRQSFEDRTEKAYQMSFARHNRGRPLFSQTDLVSARERALLAENQQLRNRNKRLKDAMLTLVERVETQLPYLQTHTPLFEKPQSTGREWQHKREKARYRNHSHQQNYSPPPKMEIYETYHEPIEFGEPAPAMRFDAKGTRKTEKKATEFKRQSKNAAADYRISPELAPEEIDILKSPTRDRPQSKPRERKTVDVVDLRPSDPPEQETAEWYEAGDESSLDIPDFEFPEEEPVLDIDFDRKETLRAAMRRRVNRLRW